MKKIAFLFDMLLLFFLFIPDLLPAQAKFRNNESQRYTDTASSIQPLSVRINDIAGLLENFYTCTNQSQLQLTIAADVPDNNHPRKVYYKQEPGHVFIILEQKDSAGNNVTQVWGFYPVKPVSSLLFKTVRCQLRDNSGRAYDASITTTIQRQALDSLKTKILLLSKKKYNLNKYNCYDYAVELFNSVAEIKLPVNHVKFPFIFGKGGSPCGLYTELAKLLRSDSSLASNIRFGNFKAPLSSSLSNSNIVHQ